MRHLRCLILIAVVAGVFFAAAQNPAPPDSLIRDANITFTTIDVPGAGYTGVFGTNSEGDLVGNYGQNTNTDSHGFLYSSGTFTLFDYPGETVTLPTGINDSGLIAGYAGDFSVVGFLYDRATFTTIRHGSDSATFVNGINNASELVGGTGSVFATKGFEMRGTRFRRLRVPGDYVYVYGSGVNRFGTVVGWADDRAFICRADTCQVFDFPGASKTEARGINDSGLMVGWYNGSGCLACSFVRKNGKYISFSYPGAKGTYAASINAAGQIVGEYTFDYQAWHGFVTSPITAADFERPGCCVVFTELGQ